MDIYFFGFFFSFIFVLWSNGQWVMSMNKDDTPSIGIGGHWQLGRGIMAPLPYSRPSYSVLRDPLRLCVRSDPYSLRCRDSSAEGMLDLGCRSITDDVPFLCFFQLWFPRGWESVSCISIILCYHSSTYLRSLESPIRHDSIGAEILWVVFFFPGLKKVTKKKKKKVKTQTKKSRCPWTFKQTPEPRHECRK